MAEQRELSRGNHLWEPAGLSCLPLPGLANPTESPSPAGICYQAEPEEIDGESANISAPEGFPFASISYKEARLIHC